MELQKRVKKKLLETGICVLFLITGCSGNVALEDVISENETIEGAVSENTVVENVVLDNTISENKPIFVSWEDAGLKDHVMEWGDRILQIHMKEITGIEDRDIMLSDVWEYTELDLHFGTFYDENGEISYMLTESISNISALGELKNLQVLNLENNKSLEDISALSSLTNLRELNLAYQSKISDSDLSAF